MLKLNLVLALALTSVLAAPIAKIPSPIASDASAQAAFGGKETRDARAGVGLFNGVNTLVSTVVDGVEVLAFDLFRGGHVKREVSDAPAHAASGKKEMRDARPVEWVIDEVEKVVDTVAVDVDLLLEGLKKILVKREASDASAQAAFGRKETRDARAGVGLFKGVNTLVSTVVAGVEVLAFDLSRAGHVKREASDAPAHAPSGRKETRDTRDLISDFVGSSSDYPAVKSGFTLLGIPLTVFADLKKDVEYIFTEPTSAAINAVKRAVGVAAKDVGARASDIVGRGLAHVLGTTISAGLT